MNTTKYKKLDRWSRTFLKVIENNDYLREWSIRDIQFEMNNILKTNKISFNELASIVLRRQKSYRKYKYQGRGKVIYIFIKANWRKNKNH